MYAKWTANTYTVVYNGNGNTGGSTASSSHTYGTAKALTANGFTKTGYSFAGWATSASGSVVYSNQQSVSNLTATHGGTVNLYAKWNINTYTVSYNANGGTGAPSNQTKTYGTNLTLSSTKPTRDGYNFTKWNTKADGSGTNYDAGATYTSNSAVTLYAQWTKKTYTVSYNANGGSGAPSAQTKTHGTNLTLSSTKPTRTGYSFTKWNTKADGTGTAYAAGASYSSNSAVTLYAQWTPVTYTISYTLNGGTVATANKTSYTIETANFTLNNPTKTGYAFAGWTGSNGTTKQTTVTIAKGSTGNKSYTANWTANTYTVAYNGNGNTGGSTASSSHTYDTAKTLTSNGFSKTGYTFNGWNTKADGSGTSYANKASVTNLTSTNGGTVTLYAKWTANTYTVAYNGNGNTGGSTASSSHTYDTAKTLTSNGFSKTGYTFNGWNTKADGSGTSYTNQASVKNLSSTKGATVNLYAQWKANTYTVAYNGNGNTGGSTASSSHTYDTAKALTANGYSKTGYTFSGWNSKADGSGNTYTDKVSVTNLTSTNNGTVTLYAQWTANTYTIKYNGNGATSGATTDSTHTYDASKALTSNGFVKTGYAFTGWNTVQDGTGTPYSDKASVQNLTATSGGTITLYAQWKLKTIETTFYRNTSENDTEKNVQSFTYGVSDQKITDNGWSKKGYTLLGWSTDRAATVEIFEPENEILDSWIDENYPSCSLYAVWKANSYTVSFDSNGGSELTESTVTVTYDAGGYHDVSGNTPTRTGYTFDGWYLEGFETQIYDANGLAVNNGTYWSESKWVHAGDLHVYAKWTPIVYTINYEPGEGATGAVTFTEHTFDEVGTFAVFEKENCKIVSWDTGTDETAEGFKSFTTVQEVLAYLAAAENGATAITLYAKWEETNCRIDVNVTISTAGINFAHGNPTFIFKATGTKYDGDYYRAVEITKDDVQVLGEGVSQITASVTFDNLVKDAYTVTEVKTYRYGIADGFDTVICDFASKTEETVNFTSAKKTAKWFGHNDLAVRIAP